jgi:hypothetical protein
MADHELGVLEYFCLRDEVSDDDIVGYAREQIVWRVSSRG